MKCARCCFWEDCQYKELGKGFCWLKPLFTYTNVKENEKCPDFIDKDSVEKETDNSNKTVGV